MQLTTTSFEPGGDIPSDFAFAKKHPSDHVELTDNKNPQLAWSDLPDGTKSLVLVCHDTDCPTSPEDVNRSGREVPADLPRTDFYHWVLVDLAPDSGPIEEGEFSSGVTARGKSGPDSARGTRSGLNNYTQWFEGDADMDGKYHGYDGPCPPWNDTLVHHYHFTLYALDSERCSVDGSFDAAAVLLAIDGHVLAKASVMGTYSLNPNL